MADRHHHHHQHQQQVLVSSKAKTSHKTRRSSREATASAFLGTEQSSILVDESGADAQSDQSGTNKKRKHSSTGSSKDLHTSLAKSINNASLIETSGLVGLELNSTTDTSSFGSRRNSSSAQQHKSNQGAQKHTTTTPQRNAGNNCSTETRNAKSKAIEAISSNSSSASTSSSTSCSTSSSSSSSSSSTNRLKHGRSRRSAEDKIDYEAHSHAGQVSSIAEDYLDDNQTIEEEAEAEAEADYDEEEQEDVESEQASGEDNCESADLAQQTDEETKSSSKSNKAAKSRRKRQRAKGRKRKSSESSAANRKRSTTTEDQPDESANTYRLRRQSSSSNKSNTKAQPADVKLNPSSSKKARLSTDSAKNSTTSSSTTSSSSSSTSLEPSSLKNHSSKNETGGCISKSSLTTTANTNTTSTSTTSTAVNRSSSTRRGQHQQQPQQEQQQQQQQAQQTTVATVGGSSKRSSANHLFDATSLFSKLTSSKSKSTSGQASMSNQQKQKETSANAPNTSSGFALIESADSSDNDAAGGAGPGGGAAAASSSSKTAATSTGNNQTSTSGAAAASSVSSATSEFSRLTDLLQSRGLPSHIVNAFGSKVQQFLHRTMSSGINTHTQQLISSLQQPDESVKLTALTELCQLLVMGNEDTLVGFPIKQAVPLLLQCMSGESENFDLMNHACRALTYMMESLPRSMSIIADGIGIFLEKLQVIQCMDVAEQALTALELLSRRHSKQILNATQSGSISACLTYIDFFSITAQRNALKITANCCQNMIKEEFVHIQSSLPILAQRLTHSDKKSVESVCTVFARLVENFQRDEQILNELASHSVLANMQQLLVVQPPLVSASMFVTILHTIYLMCSNCNQLSVDLVDNNINNTLRYLLVGPKSASTSNLSTTGQVSVEILTTRSPQELYEIVSIIGEILPRLPHTGIFSIDEVLKKSSLAHQNEHIVWQWKDEHDVWRPYTPIDSRIIEAAFIQEEDECVLNTMGRTYVIDFNAMLQINEETGTARPVNRKILAQTVTHATPTATAAVANELNPVDAAPAAQTNETTDENSNSTKGSSWSCDEAADKRLAHLNEKPHVYSEFIQSLFNIVYEVYNSSAGPAIKHRSLRTILRMIYFACSLTTTSASKSSDSTTTTTQTTTTTTNSDEERLLHSILCDIPISGHIASMLASNDTKIIVSALQLCDILMKHLPKVFSVYFYREGVIYQIDKLIEANEATPSTDATSAQSELKSEEPQQQAASVGERRSTRLSTGATAAASTTTSTSTTTNNTIDTGKQRKQRTSGTSKYTTSSSTSAASTSKPTVKPPATSSAPAPTVSSNQPTDPTGTTSNANSKTKYFKSFLSKMHSATSSGSSSTGQANPPSQSKLSVTSSSTSTAAGATSSSSFAPFSLQSQAPAGGSSSLTSGWASQSRHGSNYLNYLNNNSSRWSSSSASAKSGTAPQPPAAQSNNNLLNIALTNATSNKSRHGKSSSAAHGNEPSPLDLNLINQNKENVRKWILKQAKEFRESYFKYRADHQATSNSINVKCESSSEPEPSVKNSDVLENLKSLVVQLNQHDASQREQFACLTKIGQILKEADISSFEMIHSGLIEGLAKYLTINDARPAKTPTYSAKLKPVYAADMHKLLANEHKTVKLRLFLAVFAGLPVSEDKPNSPGDHLVIPNVRLFLVLINKLHNCVNQLEQFAVRVHDVPNSVGCGKNAIKFFNTHQLKCLLQRHPSVPSSSSNSASSLRQWKGGHVKVDPLALVGTIEKYLLMRGIHKPSSLAIAAASSSSTSGGPLKLASSLLPSKSSSTASKTATSKTAKSTGNIFKIDLINKNSTTENTTTTTTTKSKKSKQETVKPKKNAGDKLSKKTASGGIKKAKSSGKQSDTVNKKTAAAKATSKKSTAKKSSKQEEQQQQTLEMLNEETEEDMEQDGEENEPDEDDDDDGEFDDQIFASELIDDEDDDEHVDDDAHDDEHDGHDDDDDDEHDQELDEDEEHDEDELRPANANSTTSTNTNRLGTSLGANNPIVQHDDEEDEDEDDEDFDDDDDEDDDDEDDEDEIESAVNAILGTSSSSSSTGEGASRYLFKSYNQSSQYLPKLELLINNHVLPSNMTIYQAIKQYSMSNETNTNMDAENDVESAFLNNAIWSKLHVIHYRLASTTSTATEPVAKKSSDNNNNTTTSTTAAAATKRTTRQQQLQTQSQGKSKSKKDEHSSTSDSTQARNISNLNTSAIEHTQLYSTVNAAESWYSKTDSVKNDKSTESLNLLYLLNLLNRSWYLLYRELYNPSLAFKNNSFQLAPASDLLNSKLTAKANRQLQDPLVVMTGHLPKWLPDLMQTCQFLFPFETRLMYFYISSLDRDRAMQKLIDLNADLAAGNQADSSSGGSQSERMKPRLEKKKKSVNRHLDLLKQADSILNEFCVNTTTTKTPAGTSSSTSTSSTTTSTSSSSSKPAILEIQYENEVGTGLGPTLEFYALVSLELQKCSHEMWRGEKVKLNSLSDAKDAELYFSSPMGLFPAPMSLLLKGKPSSKQQTQLNKLKQKFKFLGKFVAKAVMDFRVLDLSLSQTFFKLIVDPASVTEEDLKYVDQDLYNSVQSLREYQRTRRSLLLQADHDKNSTNIEPDVEQKLHELEATVRDMDLDFTLPGYSQIELKSKGRDQLVNLENLDEYVDLLVEWTLVKGVEHQLEAFREGFECILPLSCLKLFQADELDKFICGSGYTKWDAKTLIECTRCDHGYNHDSKAVQHLFQIMCSFDAEEQRLFLQFITGSPRLPIGGLRSLVPPLTIVRKTADSSASVSNSKAGSPTSPDQYLPSVMTCVNYLKLPDYSSMDVMKSKLLQAMRDGQLSFHLS